MNTTETERVNGVAPAIPAPPKLTRAERLARDEAAKAERERIRDEARRERERRAAQWAEERDQFRERLRRARKEKRSSARSVAFQTWQARLAALWRVFVLVGAIVGVNAVAVMGQVTAFQAEPFGWPLLGALGAAAVIESIAIYVGYHAHVALIEGDSVAKLRIASYSIAAGVGAINYHHYAPDWTLNDLAVIFGAASMLSPWLWAIHSRHRHRQQLRAQGLIDPRAPKFSMLRWLLWRRETWQALRWAVRHSEQSPAAAILAIQTDDTTRAAQRLARQASVTLDAGRKALVQAQAAALAATEAYVKTLERRVNEVSEIAPPAAPEIASRADTGTDDQPDIRSVSEVSAEEKRERPDAQDNKEAEAWIRAQMRKGKTPKQADIAEKFGFSNGWASLRVKAARATLEAKGYRFLPGNRVVAPADSDTSADAVDVSDADASDAAEVSA